MERRHFLLAGSGALACASLTAPALAADAARLAPASRLSAHGFAALLNQSFNIYDSVRGVTVQLIDVSLRKSAPGSEQFTLRFQGSAGGALKRGTYQVDNPSTGTFTLYLDCDPGHADGPQYHADFNLLT